MKRFLLGLAAAAATAFAASAADFGAYPANYEAEARAYVGERLSNPHGARVEAMGQPYRVVADLGGYQGLPCWAIDVRVKSRLPSGQPGGSMTYTVIFYDGRPVALDQDVGKVARV